MGPATPAPGGRATPGRSAERRDAQDQARLEQGLVDMFENRIVFNSVLGLKVDSVKPADVRGSFAMTPALVGHFTHGRLHGGAISAVLDAMGGLAVMVAITEHHAAETAAQVMQRFGKMGTIDLRVDYIRPGVGQRFFATAKVVRLGGRVAFTQMELVNETGLLLATASASYIVS